jgi:hypothetical protein
VHGFDRSLPTRIARPVGPRRNARRLSFANGLHSEGSGPYLLFDGSLDECLREFMAKPTPVRHLYEIYTAPQPPLVSAVLSEEQIVELARLRDFL